MKGTHIGELEELILLAVAMLREDAYGTAIQNAIKEQTNRSMTISTVHAVLKRLEDKSFLESKYGGATKERGGRRKHIFSITAQGEGAIGVAREIRNKMWDAIPSMSFNQLNLTGLAKWVWNS